MKKKCFVCQIWCNECEISKFSYPHKYSWGDVTASWWQFMHTPFPNLEAHQSWSRSTMCFCYYGPLKIGPLTRCHVTHDDVIKIFSVEDRRLYGFYVYTKFHQNWSPRHRMVTIKCQEQGLAVAKIASGLTLSESDCPWSAVSPLIATLYKVYGTLDNIQKFIINHSNARLA